MLELFWELFCPSLAAWDSSSAVWLFVVLQKGAAEISKVGHLFFSYLQRARLRQSSLCTVLCVLLITPAIKGKHLAKQCSGPFLFSHFILTRQYANINVKLPPEAC